jgi:hypothetical protein
MDLLGGYGDQSDEEEQAAMSDGGDAESAVKSVEALSSLAHYLHEGADEDGDNRKADASQKPSHAASKPTMSPSPFCQVCQIPHKHFPSLDCEVS